VHFDARTDGESDGIALDTTICDDGLPGVLFCEDFEGTPKLAFTEATAPSTAAYVDTMPYRGMRSQHAHATRLSEPAWQLDSVLPSITNGELYARWYLYIPASSALVDMSALQIIESSLPYHGFIFLIKGGEVTVYTNAGDMATLPFAFPRDRWTCMRVSIVVAAAGGSLATYIDDTPGPALANIDTLPAGGYRDVHAGIFSGASAQLPQDLWTDELVVGTSPIPCD
jgi:hypothetical protein